MEDNVPAEGYAKVKKLITSILKYMGARTQTAENKAAHKLNKVRHSSFMDSVVDGVSISVRSVPGDVNGAADDAQQKVNIVNINGRQYRCANPVSMDVLVKGNDAILVKNNFDSYEEVDGDD